MIYFSGAHHPFWGRPIRRSFTILNSVAVAYDAAHLGQRAGGAVVGLLLAEVHDAAQAGVVALEFQDALADGLDESHHVFGELLLEVAVAYLATVVEVVEILHGVGRGDSLEECEEVLYLLGLLLVHLRGAAVALGFHYLFADDGGLVGEEDGGGFALALAHLAAAVEGRYLDQAGAGAYGLRQGEDIAVVHVVETLGEGAGHLEVLLLVLAHGHARGLVDEYVGGHERGVGKQAGVDVVGVLAHLVLEGGDALQLAEVGVHVEEEVELYGLRQVALQVDGGLLGVEAGGEVGGHYLAGVAVDAARRGVRGERMVVGDEEIAVILILHAHEIAQSAEIITEVKVACGAYTTANYIFSHSPVVVVNAANLQIILQY